MIKYSYALEKLLQAVHILTGKPSQKKRLELAVSMFSHIRPEEHLPVEMHEEFKKFIQEITSVPEIGEKEPVRSNINSMNDTEVRQAIEEIIGFFNKICRHSGLN